MEEEHLRRLAAENMALSYLVEVLLSRYLKQLDDLELRDKLARAIIANGQRTDQFEGVGRSEADAELLSDVTVKMHENLRTIVARALERSKASPRPAAGPGS